MRELTKYYVYTENYIFQVCVWTVKIETLMVALD